MRKILNFQALILKARFTRRISALSNSIQRNKNWQQFDVWNCCLRWFLTFASRILSVHNLWLHLSRPRSCAYWKHGGFAWILSSASYKMATALTKEEKLSRQCRKLLWVMVGLQLLDWTGKCFSMVEGNSTNTCVMISPSLLLKHHETQSRNAKLLLPIIPIGIVAYAFTPVGRRLPKQLYISLTSTGAPPFTSHCNQLIISFTWEKTNLISIAENWTN